LLAYAAKDGAVLWKTDTNRAFATVNGVEAKGGTIDGQGPVVAGDMVIVNSGYDKFGEIAGNVLLVYRLKGADR
jgi:polyvinyl alcohol dehydrogenase (cytochrome)